MPITYDPGVKKERSSYSTTRALGGASVSVKENPSSGIGTPFQSSTAKQAGVTEYAGAGVSVFEGSKKTGATPIVQEEVIYKPGISRSGSFKTSAGETVTVKTTEASASAQSERERMLREAESQGKLRQAQEAELRRIREEEFIKSSRSREIATDREASRRVTVKLEEEGIRKASDFFAAAQSGRLDIRGREIYLQKNNAPKGTETSQEGRPTAPRSVSLSETMIVRPEEDFSYLFPQENRGGAGQSQINAIDPNYQIAGRSLKYKTEEFFSKAEQALPSLGEELTDTGKLLIIPALGAKAVLGLAKGSFDFGKGINQLYQAAPKGKDLLNPIKTGVFITESAEGITQGIAEQADKTITAVSLGDVLELSQIGGEIYAQTKLSIIGEKAVKSTVKGAFVDFGRKLKFTEATSRSVDNDYLFIKPRYDIKGNIEGGFIPEDINYGLSGSAEIQAQLYNKAVNPEIKPGSPLNRISNTPGEPYTPEFLMRAENKPGQSKLVNLELIKNSPSTLTAKEVIQTFQEEKAAAPGEQKSLITKTESGEVVRLYGDPFTAIITEGARIYEENKPLIKSFLEVERPGRTISPTETSAPEIRTAIPIIFGSLAPTSGIVISQSSGQGMIQTQKPEVKIINSAIQRQAVSPDITIITAPMIKTSSALIQRNNLITSPISSTIPASVVISESNTIYKPLVANPLRSPEISAPPVPLPPYKSKNSLFSRNKDLKILVRRMGVFKEIGTAKTTGEALIIGQGIVKRSAAASFKITSGGLPITDIRPSSDFIPSKRERGVFIQRKELRITSAEEKAEITYKGIFANRAKSKIKNLFGGM